MFKQIGKALAATVLGVVAALPCQAGEHQRRFEAELAVIAGDARLLLAQETPDPEKIGLHARIESALSSLRILARQYLQELDKSDQEALDGIEALRRAFESDRLHAFRRQAEYLTARYPLALRGLRAVDAQPDDVVGGRNLYRNLCQGCHEATSPSATNPARNLFQEARRLPQQELTARLLLGIRGTPAVSLKNPFTDAQIAGLAAYLRDGP